jgi:hypothetical protein
MPSAYVAASQVQSFNFSSFHQRMEESHPDAEDIEDIDGEELADLDGERARNGGAIEQR